jgi:hypothetical protein
MSSLSLYNDNNSNTYSFLTLTLTSVLIVVVVQVIRLSNKINAATATTATTTAATAATPVVTPVAKPVIPVTCSFTCPCCNNTYSDRVKYGKEFDGAWFCNSTCNTMYKTRQMYAKMNTGPCVFPYNSNLAPVFPLRVIARDGVVKMIF